MESRSLEHHAYGLDNPLHSPFLVAGWAGVEGILDDALLDFGNLVAA